MPASQNTVHQVYCILVAELGAERAHRIVSQLYTQTKGNKSYTRTIHALLTLLQRKVYVTGGAV